MNTVNVQDRPYMLAETSLLLDAPEREYVLTINDLPSEEKPREKLLSHGPSTLSVGELLAVLFVTGSRKEDVLTMSNRLLKEYGEKAILHEKDPERVRNALNIPITKACQLVACLELGRRFFRKPRFGPPEFLRSAKEVYDYLKDMRTLRKEYFHGLYLDGRFRLVHDEVISIGSLNANLVHPREVFKPAMDIGAAAIILAHNHPSGDPTPSDTDVAVTEQLVSAGKILGIEVLDHVIISNIGFKSVMTERD